MGARKKGLEQHLADAAEALAKVDDEGAVLALVKAWAIAPTDRIAHLVFDLGARIPAPPLGGKTVAAREQAWVDLAGTLDPAAVPTLLSVDWPVHPRAAKARIKLLRKFPPDPRIVRSLVELRKSGRYDSNAGHMFWGWVFEALYKWRYPAVHAVFATSLDGGTSDLESFRLQPLRARPRHPEPILSEAADALISRMAGEGIRLPNPASRDAQRAALFDAVYETPADDAPRLVLADFLIEEGDARGEFIQLDLRLAVDGKLPAKAMQRRQALARAAGKTWFEGFAASVSGVELRRGFAVSASVAGPFDPSPRVYRTLERLAFPWGPDVEEKVARAILDPNLVSLRELQGCDAALFHALVRAKRPRRFERIYLGLEGWSDAEPLRTAIAITVRHLVAPTFTIAAVFLEGYLDAMNVEVLTVDGDTAALLALAARLERLPPSLTRLEVDLDSLGWKLGFTRVARAGWRYDARWLGRGAPDLATRDKLIAQLPARLEAGS